MDTAERVSVPLRESGPDEQPVTLRRPWCASWVPTLRVVPGPTPALVPSSDWAGETRKADRVQRGRDEEHRQVVAGIRVQQTARQFGRGDAHHAGLEATETRDGAGRAAGKQIRRDRNTIVDHAWCAPHATAIRPTTMTGWSSRPAAITEGTMMATRIAKVASRAPFTLQPR